MMRALSAYEIKKKREALRNRKASQAGRDIAPLPAIAAPERRELCRLNFKLFCETYFPNVFNLAWSDDHLEVIRIIEDAVLHGGLFAVAMPRGSGKTELSKAATIWATFFGHRRFVTVIGATEDAAGDILHKIKTDLSTNDLLAADFPEICYPIKCLEGIVHRAAGQLLNGRQTGIGWTAKEIILPLVPGAVSSGAVMRAFGITGNIRGMNVTHPTEGYSVRPDFIFLDDVQTDESARSPKQVHDRLTTIQGTILGLAGPGQKIAAVMPITVISKGDVADEILDQKKYPQWQGRRFKMMKSLPTAVKLWEQYAEIRAISLRSGKGISEATAFYIEHKNQLDAGAVASWAARYNPDEASAIQHAMNLKLSSEAAFASEYQNEPLSLDSNTPLLLTPDQVTAKAVNIDRGIVPTWATTLTAYVDVQGACLFYVVAAWGPGFSGHVIDYGAWPDQEQNYFTLREVGRTMAKAKPFTSFEGYLHNGLDKLTSQLLGREWERQDRGANRISRLIIDANWGDSTTIVKQFCRDSSFATQLLAGHGRGIGPDRKPMNDYLPKPGERPGWNWRIMPAPDRHIVYDVNAWKTFTAQRILNSTGETGNLSIFRGSPTQHRMFGEQVTAEYPTPTEGMGRTVNVWKTKVSRDNHYLDCLVGCAVAASEQGIAATIGHGPAVVATTPRTRRRLQVSF